MEILQKLITGLKFPDFATILHYVTMTEILMICVAMLLILAYKLYKFVRNQVSDDDRQH